MLKIKIIPVAIKIASKIELSPILSAVSEINKNQTDDASKKTELGFAVLEALLPQLGKIADDVTELIAAYEGVSATEAGELDAIGEFKKIAQDAGLINFFKSALREKSGKRK
nr:MAG TPA: hypothetical protein [Caudoviricetes sp.]